MSATLYFQAAGRTSKIQVSDTDGAVFQRVFSEWFSRFDRLNILIRFTDGAGASFSTIGPGDYVLEFSRERDQPTGHRIAEELLAGVTDEEVTAFVDKIQAEGMLTLGNLIS